ncbi:CACNA1C [Symbiodinium pilosum]|uniref:CACNA1C protein n=1 Tax=Symbiodinium pilosum TaxID=2952 RepID=A0A812WAE5_SYMPI|nr:CACNA1C [Symbiodinium pilosum]
MALPTPDAPPRLLEGIGDYAELARCAKQYQRRRSMAERRIVVDILLTCIDIDIRASGGSSPFVLELLSNFCLALYTVELMAIIFVKRVQVFQDPWTLLDMLIVVFGLVQVLLGFVGVSLDRVTSLRMLRVVRIMRLFRLFRKFVMLKELRKLIRMTASCFKTLCWSFLFCFVVMTSWAMLAVELLNPYMSELSYFWDDCEFCKRSLQSVMSANLLLFKTVVAGDSWGKVAVPLIEAHPWTATPIFIGSQLSIVFGVLNLVVAVVVDTFAEQRTKDVTSMAQEMDEDAEEELQELDKIFAKIDSDNDGQLSWEELVKGAQKVREFQHRLRVMDIDQTDLQQLFSMLDHNQNSTVDPDEFKRTLARWAFDSKTATRFVRYTLQQLMDDHSSAAEKLSKMESLVRDSFQDAPAPPRRRRRRRKAAL